MKILDKIYDGSMTLLTDLYQLTMAYGYWKSGKAEQETVFNLFFRKNPFGGGFTVMCGLEYVIDFIENFRFNEEDITYLSTVKTSNGNTMFEEDFLDYLRNLKFTCEVDAIPEGTLVFPHEPMIRVRGPIIQAQLIETPLLNIINFQSLIATKAARVKLAAKDDDVIELGLRRAQGIDGALAASRASFIGGCSSTSNILAAKLFGIPVAGTHAHSWIMSFDTELEAFKKYAELMPDNCIFLVDTYDTIQGIKNAIVVGKSLEKKGKRLVGIRIDSGDLAYFSKTARQMLDAAGLTETKVVASNDIDEHIIRSLKMEQEAKIDIWGVGTKMVTAYDQPALGAVYKISAIKREDGNWTNKIKLSEQSIKVNHPGIQQVRRFFKDGKAIADMIFDVRNTLGTENELIDPLDPTRRKILDTKNYGFRDLLEPIFRNGECLYETPDIERIRKHLKDELGKFNEGEKRFVNPHIFPVGLEKSLFEEKTELMLKLRRVKHDKE